MASPRALLAMLGLAMAATPAAAATYITGGNIVNQTWTPAGNPYIVQGDITVPAGAFLTMQAGTIVQFASTDGQAAGRDTSRVELTVNGTLNISGTAASPVSLSAQSGSAANIWYGIIIGSGATSANIAYANISNAGAGIASVAPGNVLQLSHTMIQTSTVGIAVQGGTPTIDSVTVDNCPYYGIQVTGSGSGATISNTIIRNSGDGVYFDVTSTPTLRITGSTIHANNRGVVWGTPFAVTATLDLRDSIVSNNISYGLYSEGPGGIFLVDHDDVWGNATNFHNVPSGGIGMISVDPRYVAPPSDLHLSPDSACIDTGTATYASNHDHDGTMRPLGAGYDMGAYETSGVIFANGFEGP